MVAVCVVLLCKYKVEVLMKLTLLVVAVLLVPPSPLPILFALKNAGMNNLEDPISCNQDEVHLHHPRPSPPQAKTKTLFRSPPRPSTTTENKSGSATDWVTEQQAKQCPKP